MSMRFVTLALLAVGLACAGCESSEKDDDDDDRRAERRSGRARERDQSHGVERRGRMHVGDPDQHFMAMAAQDSLAEIRYSRIASERSNNEQVRRLAERIIEDHQRANQELKQLAQRKDVTLPGRLNDSQQSMVDHFSSLSGRELDKEFAGHMEAGHAKMVQMFEDKARGAQDADLRNWAQQMLPTLREHLRMARELNNSLGGASPRQRRDPRDRP